MKVLQGTGRLQKNEANVIRKRIREGRGIEKGMEMTNIRYRREEEGYKKQRTEKGNQDQ